MQLNELVELQRQFDEQHATNFQWNEEITEENLNMLKFIMISLAGEVGEMAGLIKKILRGDHSLDSTLPAISEECADIFAYLIKMCYQLNINLEDAFLQKLEKNRDRFKNYER